MSVAPRWKRRADEIAEAIGDELSVNGTVSIGNDVSLSVATITALANAITSVLNSASIARAMWTSDIVGTHDARAVYTVDGGGYWSITAPGGVAGAGASPAFIYQVDGTTAISARSGAEDRHEDVIFLNNVWQLPIAIVRNVNVLSTVQQPVHVELKNVTGGFTALGVNVSNAMKLSAQPISIASTVDVKTATGEAVAITGTVNANVGSATLPISNPNNITVPVRATSTGIPQNASGVNVICPVNVGSSTVPVKATTAGIPQNANGISLYLPVDANHGLTIPVGGGVSSIPVGSTGLTSIPVSNPNNVTVLVENTNSVVVPVRTVTGTTNAASVTGTAVVVPVTNANNISVLVENTNSVVVPVRTVTGTTNAADGTGAAVVVPVTSSGTVVDVKLVEVAVGAKTSFHEAMEDAINDAEELTGVIVGPNIHTTASSPPSPVWDILGSNGVTYTSQYLAADSPQTNNPGSRHVLEPRSVEELRKYLGRRVRFNTNATAQYASPQANGKEWFLLIDGATVFATDRAVFIASVHNVSTHYKFDLMYADGTAASTARVRVYDASSDNWLTQSNNHVGKVVAIWHAYGPNTYMTVQHDTF